MEQIVLTAPDISCEHCINAINRAVSAIAGVTFVEGSPESKQVTITFDPGQATLDTIKAAMDEEGYPVAAVSAVGQPVR